MKHRDFSDHGDPEAPGPPRARQVVGLGVIILGALFMTGTVPFTATTAGIALILVGAGLAL